MAKKQDEHAIKRANCSKKRDGDEHAKWNSFGNGRRIPASEGRVLGDPSRPVTKSVFMFSSGLFLGWGRRGGEGVATGGEMEIGKE